VLAPAQLLLLLAREKLKLLHLLRGQLLPALVLKLLRFQPALDLTLRGRRGATEKFREV
jgi:hypothetical protein